jgi:hypothetical protein
MARHFPLPWSAEVTPNCFIVRDANGQARQATSIMRVSRGGDQRPSCSAKMRLLVEIKAQFNAPSLGSAGRASDPPRGVAMLRTITKHMFDAVAALTIIATIFYLAAIAHIVPLPGNALKRLGEVSVEPISKLSEEDNEASELDKAEEVLSVEFPADEYAALPLYPGEETLDEPASHIAA